LALLPKPQILFLGLSDVLRLLQAGGCVSLTATDGDIHGGEASSGPCIDAINQLGQQAQPLA